MRSPLDERTTVATLLVLTFTAGLIDAVCFLRLGHVFVANMTGNVVFLGVNAANTAGRILLGSSVSLAAYMLGALAGGRLWRFLRHRPRAWHTAVWGSHGFLLLAAALLAWTAPFREQLWLASVFIALLAVGFGMQNATVRIMGVADLTTTVLTATITQLASESRFGTGARPKPWRKIASISMIVLGAGVGALLLRVFAVGSATAGVTAVAAALVTGVALVYAFAPTRAEEPEPAAG
ncbi:MAG: YoaK family protein [Segniliparus sp.]|uniref:YoaK family protein n=1 Tax=Segniliparus sp. TaxID=2804064 RepID=UPI003F2A40BE